MVVGEGKRLFSCQREADSDSDRNSVLGRLKMAYQLRDSSLQNIEKEENSFITE